MMRQRNPTIRTIFAQVRKAYIVEVNNYGILDGFANGEQIFSLATEKMETIIRYMRRNGVVFVDCRRANAEPIPRRFDSLGELAEHLAYMERYGTPYFFASTIHHEMKMEWVTGSVASLGSASL